MKAQWDSSLSALSATWVQFPATAEYFKGFFPGSHVAREVGHLRLVEDERF